MDPLSTWLTANALLLFKLAACLFIASEIIGAIPADRFPPSTVFGLVVLMLRAGIGAARKVVGRLLGGPAGPTALLAVGLAALLLPRMAWPDEPPVLAPTAPPPVVIAPIAPVVADSPPSNEAAKTGTPTLIDVALCTAQTLPGTIGKCAGLPSSPRMDDRSFYTALFGTLGAGVTTIGGLLTLYLNPPPIR